MQIDRARQLANEYGYTLKPGTGYDWNLHDTASGQYIDTLHQTQIGFLNEEDFVEFYLR